MLCLLVNVLLSRGTSILDGCGIGSAVAIRCVTPLEWRITSSSSVSMGGTSASSAATKVPATLITWNIKKEQCHHHFRHHHQNNMRKPVFMVWTWSNTNWAVQP